MDKQHVDRFVSEISESIDKNTEIKPSVLNKYSRQIAKIDCDCGHAHIVNVDVYDVLGAFTGHYPQRIKPIIDHLLKKLLAGGERGHKSLEQDIDDVIQSAKRAMHLLGEWRDD